jgi:hypothetical protein
MDASDILKNAILTVFREYWYFFLLIVLFFVLLTTLKVIFIRVFKKKSKNIKGLVGEKKVVAILKKLNPQEYKIINNKIFDFNKSKAQIDHLIISNYGIFVIETKNFEGTIFGEEDSNYWTQKFYNSKENFRNPIKQNAWHIEALKNILAKYPQATYYSIIVFTKNSDLRIKTITDVVNTDDLIEAIYRHQDRVISDMDRDQIYNYLNKKSY